SLGVSFETGRVHDEVLKHCRDNLAMCGRGVPWLRYVASGAGEAFTERLSWEWLHRKRFCHEPALCWYQVGWVARLDYFTDVQGQRRFKAKWKDIALKQTEDTDEEYRFEDKAEVWQLWHRESGKVYWVHLDSPELLDVQDARDV